MKHLQYNVKNVDKKNKKILNEIKSIKNTIQEHKNYFNKLSHYFQKNIKNDQKNEIDICVICREKLLNNDDLFLNNNCIHVFHQKCIKKNLQYSDYCPICRIKISK